MKSKKAKPKWSVRRLNYPQVRGNKRVLFGQTIECTILNKLNPTEGYSLDETSNLVVSPNADFVRYQTWYFDHTAIANCDSVYDLLKDSHNRYLEPEVPLYFKVYIDLNVGVQPKACAKLHTEYVNTIIVHGMYTQTDGLEITLFVHYYSYCETYIPVDTTHMDEMKSCDNLKFKAVSTKHIGAVISNRDTFLNTTYSCIENEKFQEVTLETTLKQLGVEI